jgi:hypothetical protein
MKNDKGLIILLIIITSISLVVYLSKSKDTKVPYQNVDNKSPSIEITSPKNGSVYHVGDTVTIHWKLKNVPYNSLVQSELRTEKYNSCGEGLTQDSYSQTSTFLIQERFCQGKFEGIDSKEGSPYQITMNVVNDGKEIAKSEPLTIQVR